MPIVNLGKVRGDDGANVYIKYNLVAADAGASDIFSTGIHKYIGTMTSASKTKPTSGYTWVKFVGEDGNAGSPGVSGTNGRDGNNGSNGTNGKDGKNCYIKYSTTSSITGATDIWSVGQSWLGIAFTNSEAAPTQNSEYCWSKFIDESKLDKAQVLNCVYPIGSIYESAVNISPAAFIGGVWVSYGAGQVLVGSGTYNGSVDEGGMVNYVAGNTSGERKHKLSIAEMPSHNHEFVNPGTQKLALEVFEHKEQYYSGAMTHAGNSGFVYGIDSAGGSAAHDNMPPYIVVNRWRRTA